VDQALYLRAVDYFNRADFFEAHETWEDIWRASSGPEKKFLQGLIQIAVALHHHSTGNLRGAQSLLKRGCKNLDGCPDVFGGVKLAPMLQAVACWQRALDDGEPLPPLPTLQPGDRYL
jgi:predicted metal-dependent hydrolase